MRPSLGGSLALPGRNLLKSQVRGARGTRSNSDRVVRQQKIAKARKDESAKEHDIMSEASKSIAELLVQHQMHWKQLAEKSGLDEQRVTAIILGRWTPSPEDRDAIAAVFGMTREQIAWGHKTPIQHIYGMGPG